MATGKSGGFWGKAAKPVVPPGNALLAKEQAATARQAAGKNPSIDPIHALLHGTASPTQRTARAAGVGINAKPIGGPAFSLGTSVLQQLIQAPATIHGALAAGKELSHPTPAHPLSLTRSFEDVLAGGMGVPFGRVKYEPRIIKHNELEAQGQKARSRITNVGEKIVEKASAGLQKSERATKVPGVRLATSGERAVKAAGRAQRIERPRADAEVAQHLKAIKDVKEGSPEDVANFWYAQLPKTHRNAAGLALIRAKQAEELQSLTSGERLDAINNHIAALNAQIKETDNPFPILKEIEKAKVALADIPSRADATAASIAQLDDLIVKPPAENVAATTAVNELNAVREPILSDNNRLKAEHAQERKGLVSRWVGLEPTGEEAYIGHRLAQPDGTGVHGFAPTAGVGRVASPKGVGSQNNLVLASNGRLRPSLHVALEDHATGQGFRMGIEARNDLGKAGEPYNPGQHVPGNHVLINPKAHVVPPWWKAEDHAQFANGNADEIRAKSSEIVSQFIGQDPAGWEKIKQEALDQGVDWSELRVVSKRLADRYYSQFRSMKGKAGTPTKIYDGLVDAVSTSIVFARVGYVPKNLVQNVIMAVPHQGAFLPQNLVKAAQAATNPDLRALMRAEISGTGATGSLGNQMVHQKLMGGITHFVTKWADDPVRLSALMHELQAAGVISRSHPLLTSADEQTLIRFFKNKSNRRLLNDIRSRTVESMADFSRMTPDQARQARRFLIIPGWLMAGTRYPFHFAATHPIRSALLAYIAMGEPGAPNGLQFNKPVNEYIHGKGYKQGIDTPFGRVRTNSISPVSTPWDLGQSAVGTVRGKQGPFDFNTPTIFDEAQPLVASLIGAAQGEGIKKSLRRLAPGESFIEQEIHPKASKNYPEDRTRWGRFKREVGVIPIQVEDNPPKSSGGSNSFWGSPTKKSGGSSNSFWGK